jgi:hypothetical protein
MSESRYDAGSGTGRRCAIAIPATRRIGLSLRGALRLADALPAHTSG